MLNRTSITESHQSAKQDYENIGVKFSEIASNGYHNLTITVPAILPMNNTDVSCTVRNSSKSAVNMSNTVSLILFDTLSKFTIIFIVVIMHDGLM